MIEKSKKIQSDILTFINKYKDHQTERYESDFNQLVMRIFAYQFQNNLPYKKFAQL